MTAIYLFYDNKNTSIPSSGKDFRLYNLFCKTGGGSWNDEGKEFVFNRKLDADKLSLFIPDLPIVKVGYNAPGFLGIKGFFGRPWLDDAVSNYFSDEWLEKLEAELHARKYSPNTIKRYIYYNRSICQWLKKPPNLISNDDVKNYLAYRERRDNQSAASLNLALSAIKFFFCNVLGSDVIREQKRPKQDKRLPVVLSKEEIKRILGRVKNTKHRLLLMLVYSSGLRVGEVVSLKKQDIDLDRKSIIIISGKGRKDRYTITSDKVIETLKDYYERYEIKDWLFPGQPESRHLHIRSAQHIFEKAVKRAGIEKDASIHCLRHSFATHLLESGIEIRYIQNLLGHTSVRTTERYTHVARRKVLAITSPLDTII
ncbi:MAG: tyrosine-type recombinase/integrase [Treponema sp.]|nr:tyrosine-type recombinase/integrase [Treponema sp.]